ncbi:MAG: twin-arginine translocase subunit TatC [Anaerolineaceae bacterium]|jgi:sec-independent protein translocase protein TatC|nr:twin-arginine translocase subunit TatC [Anaerolineaceae bacterium]
MSAEKTPIMSIWDHINELRKRLFVAVISLAVTTLISFAVVPYLLDFITVPVGGIENLQSIEITENIGVFMRISLLSGFLFAFPIVLSQILLFIAPGLEKNEKRWIFITIPIATVLFLAGAAFAYFVMLPVAIPYLINFLGVPTTPRLLSYVKFTTSLIFWLGIGFELPIFVFALAKFRLVTPHTLLKQWRIAIVLIAVAAAAITPTIDPINMAILMLPLFLLYLISVLFAFIAIR